MFLKAVILVVSLAVASAGLIGGPIDVDINEPDVQEALSFAVAQHNKASNDMYVNGVSKVIGVQKQVVAGLKYIFTIEMARTSCRKGGVEEKCNIHSDPSIANPRKCELAVWSRPWMNSIVVVKNTC